MNIQRILANETEVLNLMYVTDFFDSGSGIPESTAGQSAGTELPAMNGFLPDQEGSSLPFPFIAFGDEDEDEDADEEEDNFDDMEDDFDDDFDDDEDEFDDDDEFEDEDDDDYDYDDDSDYDDDYEE